MQPLKLDDLSVLAENQKLGASNNTVTNKNQAIYKQNTSFNSNNVKNSMSVSMSGPGQAQQYSMQSNISKKLTNHDFNNINKFSVLNK